MGRTFKILDHYESPFIFIHSKIFTHFSLIFVKILKDGKNEFKNYKNGVMFGIVFL